MNADVKGALAQINTSWNAFTHKGQRMSKNQVKAVLEYAVSKGYKTTAELNDNEVDEIINNLK